MMKIALMKSSMVLVSLLVCGCSISEQNATKNASIGLITTPASYYSSAKARYLGAKYKNNLDRLAERIVRNPKTARLQFANNIASVGGIGFFTHSAASTSDERFLEVILSAPETFEAKGELNQKILSVFTAYGRELLAILVADPDIYQEREVSGYGLNLTWRSLVSDPKGPRVFLERAVIYIAKEKVKGLLDRENDANKYLAEAVIFTGSDNGPVTLASYRQQDRGPDTRLPIQEESLSAGQPESRPETNPSPYFQAEPVKESRRPPANAPEAQSAPVAADVPNGSAQPSSLESKGRILREEPGTLRSSRSDLRVRPAEAMKRPDYETMAKKPVAQAHVPSMRDLTTSEVKGIPQKSMVGRPDDEAGELKKKEAGPIASSPGKAEVRASIDAAGDPARDIKKSGFVRKTDLAPAKLEAKGSAGSTPERSSESMSDKGGAERIPLRSRTVQIKPATNTPPKALEGFIIQLAFTDRAHAQSWAETMERRGYAVSVTEAGERESVRVRVGNFAFRDEADRELLSFKRNGLVGIVINLPQAYRPEARMPSPDTTQAQ